MSFLGNMDRFIASPPEDPTLQMKLLAWIDLVKSRAPPAIDWERQVP
jgi:hypothetical protein